ncbi:hypothetical protein EX30DRAFT_341040 [Ascodesmis nigricans]|uniref:Uncharacterized protein n=1 Tax=Ascodesmis nigricans TaxID=341454 RepID=A0A4S2MWY2_9PEZI|nr:hypothetical protein EX30DRAFT_341040 [Ascodesmis nigricans]
MSQLRSRVGRVFNHHDDEDDPTIPSGVLDVDEQDHIIETLRKEDLERTQRACRLVSIVIVLPFPYFLVRFLLSPSWFEFWCMLFIAGAYITGPGPDAASLGRKDVSVLLVRSGYLNLISVTAVSLYYWAFWWRGTESQVPERRFDWSGEDHQVLIVPLVISVLSFISRRHLVPTDLKDLVSSKYEYLGA